MRDELPKEKVSSAVALMSATLGIGGALGLPLGGLMFGRLGWSSVFWLSVVVGVAIGVAVMLVVPESGVKTRGRFDLLGALLLSVALTCLLLVISKGGRWGGEPVLALFIVDGGRAGRSGCPTRCRSASRWWTCAPRPAGRCC